MTNETKLSKAELWAKEYGCNECSELAKHGLFEVVMDLADFDHTIQEIILAAIKWTIEQSEQLAIKPEPVEVTQFEPFVLLKDLKGLV